MVCICCEILDKLTFITCKVTILSLNWQYLEYWKYDNRYVLSFESLYLLFPGRRNSGSSQLARSVFQSYPPLISSVLCPTRGRETKCLFLKGKSWDSTDQLKNANHATKRMYSYTKKQKNQLAYLSRFE